MTAIVTAVTLLGAGACTQSHQLLSDGPDGSPDAVASLDGMDGEASRTNADVASDRSGDSPALSDADGGSCSAGAVAPLVVASRTTCAAPCAVFFDATGTTGLSGGDYVGANWNWDFNDPSSPHPATIGFVVAHVFDHPGTYKVTTLVRDVAGSSGSTTTTITVSAMTGTTYYVANSGSDSNNGTSMTTPLLTIAQALSVGGATNNSVLLRQGDAFSVTTGINLAETGPFLLGSYSDPAAPSTAKPNLTNNSGEGVFQINGSDIRVTDLLITNPQQSTTAFNSDVAPNKLMERVEVNGGGTAFFQANPVAVGFFVVDCYAHDMQAGGSGIVGSESSQFVVIGTTIGNFDTSGGNAILNQGSDPLGTGGPVTNSYIADSTFIPESPSENDGFGSVSERPHNTNAVIVNNYIACQLELQNGQDALVEGNTIVGQAQISMEDKHVFIRNNVFAGVASAPDALPGSLGDGTPPVAITVQAGTALRPVTWVDQVFVYNNTMYSYYPAVETNGIFLVQHKTTTGSLVVVNNILVTGNNSFANRVVNADGAGTETFSNNLIYAPNTPSMLTSPNVGMGGVVQQDPEFVSTDLTMPNFFRLSAGSPAIDVGAMVPVYQDFAGTPRPVGAGWDIGAYEYAP